MAWTFGDSFDLYAAAADLLAGYWDSGSANVTLPAGRFTGSQAIQFTNALANLVKSSGQNDPVHHIVCAFEQTAVISGSTLGTYFTLSDGATAQCSIVFRSDGAILLTSGGPAGTVLATYSGAFTANTWNAYEFEVVINNTTGSFKVRANGVTSDSFSATSLNTRASANNYANKLTVGLQGAVSSHLIDDLLWRSDATSGSGLATWVGDIRCYARMPNADAAVQFSPSPVAVSVQASTIALSINQGRYSPVAAQPANVGITSVSVYANTAQTGNLKCAIFQDSAGNPGVLLGTATNVINNPAIGANVFSFSPAVTVPEGTQFWIGVNCDTAMTLVGTGSNSARTHSLSYASFPVSNPSGLAGAQFGFGYSFSSTALNNYSLVNEPQQDGATSYIFDSTAGHNDFYNIAPIPVTPIATIAVTTRSFAQKSDAGARNGAVQLKSGSSTVTSPSTPLTTSWGWLWRTDSNDPSTGSAWTATGVNNAQVGPTVTA